MRVQESHRAALCLSRHSHEPAQPKLFTTTSTSRRTRWFLLETTAMNFDSFWRSTGPTGFGKRSTSEQVTEGLSLAGKTIMVTGCNSGLGAETCRVLLLRGAQVIATARSLEKATEACAAWPAGRTTPLACDLAAPASIRACVSAIAASGQLLDAIICNAGIMAVPSLEQVHGIERQFFTNHLGHFMVVEGLRARLAADGRVVVVSSSAHRAAPKGGIDFDNLSGERRYWAWQAYSRSKFANLLFAKELNRRFAGTQRTAYAVHPGTIATNIGRTMNGALNFAFKALGPSLFKRVDQGAATQLFAAVHPKALALAGCYLADCNAARPRADALDPALAARLWATSEELVKNLE